MGNSSHTVTLRTNRTLSETEMKEDVEQVDYRVPNARPGSRADFQDMLRMGKRQEFSRNFSFLSIVGYSIVATSSWQGQLTSSLSGMGEDGTGLSNLVWAYLFVFLLWCCVSASLAEMASMAPTSGGQYHWVSEFAPRRYSHLLSYVIGWCSMLAWQCNFVSFSSDISEHIQSVLIINGSDFKFQVWQLNLMVMLVATLAVVFNANIRNSLPLLGGAFVLLYICIFLAVLVTLWVLAPRTNAEKVFFSLSDRGDPRGILVSLIFNLFEPVLTSMSPDNIIHMAEEVKDSSIVLPRAILTSTIFNGIFGFMMIITFCFTIGDIQGVSSSGITTHIDILFNATHSAAATTLITALVDIVSIGSSICALTSASRQLFAFARDKGVPFSSFIAYVRPGWNVPLNAMLVSYGFCAIYCIINIFWSPSTGVIVIFLVTGNIFSYLVSITCLRLKRWRNEPLPNQRWSLGRWGGPINDVAIVFLAFLFVLFFVPNSLHVNAANMSYGIVVWGGIVLISIASYYFKGRKVYTSPVTFVRKQC